MNHNLGLLADYRRSLNAVAAGTGDTQVGTGIDTKGYEGVIFVFALGTIVATAVTTCKVQQSSDDGAADAYDDLAGTGQSYADTDDNKVAMIDVYQPQKRYVRPAVVRATANITIDAVFALLYRAGQRPPAAAHSTAVRLPKVFNSPAEGAA